jgi:HTH-type transcriptional regulator, sugar sensing transcriptional regulator
MTDIKETIQKIGLTDKAAAVYLAALELGEAPVQTLAKQAGLKRTTVYYTIEELLGFGALTKIKRGKKMTYIAENPNQVLRRARERLLDFEEALPELERHRNKAIPTPKAYFLYGVPGFKKVWDKIFASGETEYLIITEGESFLDYVKEKYILQEIIQKKRKLGIYSRQLITESPYARKIIAKDFKENRESRVLPPIYKFPFTEIVCGSFVAFTSPRFENLLIVIDSQSYAKSQRSLFEAVWNAVGKASRNK